MTPTPKGFDFGKFTPVAQPSPVQDNEETEEVEAADEAPRKAPMGKRSTGVDLKTMLRSVSLLSEALPYLRKFADYKMNSKKKGTKQGEECKQLVEKIDVFIASSDL